MSKRFGRNQKRRLTERAESAERVLSSVKTTFHELFQENAKLKAKLQRSIEIDCEVLRDNSRGDYEARLEAHRLGYKEGLYVMQRIEARELATQRDRNGFIEQCSRHMASQLARAIGERWT